MKINNILFLAILLSIFSCTPEFDDNLSDPLLGADGLSNESGSSGENGGEPSSNIIVENPFIKVDNEAISTFSIDADGAAYTTMRRQLNEGRLPSPDLIRTEELVNYFNYDYPEPDAGRPISLNGEISRCPWKSDHHLMRIGLKGQTIDPIDFPASNIVFLIDVSGSMTFEDRLPLLQKGFKKYVDQMRSIDRVALVTYAGNAGVVLESTSGSEKDKIKEAIDNLRSGGSTNGEGGLIEAYSIAEANFVEGANNRVIVASDGNFNVGISGQEALVELIEEKRESGIFLTILGVGSNVNEGTLEQIANNGNGNFEYLDNEDQLDKVFIDEFNKFYTVAKDVKVQVEFNSSVVEEYRLIGYENRLLSTEEFLDDTKDAGEIGAGQSITALYELKLVSNHDKSISAFKIDFRYKEPDSDVSQGLDLDIFNSGNSFDEASNDHRFAASVASFGLLLRDSEYKGDTDYSKIKNWATSSRNYDPFGYKSEFLQLIDRADDLD
jgi:Ca-activated chloride channel family protein